MSPDADLINAYRSIMRLGIGHGLDAGDQPIEPEQQGEVGVRLDLIATKMANRLEHLTFNSPEIKNEIANRIRDWMERDGDITMSSLASSLESLVGGVRALAIARTESGTAYNASAAIGYKAAGFTHVTWIASADACPECQELDGETMEIEAYLSDPLAHVNCACSSEPAEEGEQEPSGYDMGETELEQGE